MASEMVERAHIVQDEGICGGHPRIAGTRIKIQHIVLEYGRLGLTPDQICDAHPGLSLADVHAAIAYYYDHKGSVLFRMIHRTPLSDYLTLLNLSNSYMGS